MKFKSTKFHWIAQAVAKKPHSHLTLHLIKTIKAQLRVITLLETILMKFVCLETDTHAHSS